MSAAAQAWPGGRRFKGLLVDFGGVLTTNVFESFRGFSIDEGLDPDAIKHLFRGEPEAVASCAGWRPGT
jgi:putative hydrolase of the HAD superfamily